MRTAPGKNRGYVVLPVVIPAGIEPHEALDDNQTYKVVWQVLQALRSHDDRFDAMVNKLDLVGPDRSRMEVVAIADTVQRKTARLTDSSAKRAGKAKGKYAIGETQGDYPAEVQGQLEFEVGEIERALYAKVVDKCGNRHHWEDWANDIAKIAQTHIDRIKALLEDPAQSSARQAFDAFASELRDDLNDKVSDAEIIEMLAQHLITKPVFDALFADYSFAKHNPMSRAMQKVLDVLHEQHLDKEASTLQEFYDSVKLRAEGIDSAAGKQKLVKELYDKFFNNAFPELARRLGIVYTPIEVVDFIIHSVSHILKTEFGKTLGSEGVHILDPFTGTGTFITRLMQSGLISSEELKRKYEKEIHANEIVLLAYYIAAINIEATYHSIVGEDYAPFEGILLTDTFQMYEKDDMVDALLADNSARRKRQKALDIRVIVGNPPYAESQDSATEAKSVDYPTLDNRIMSTYGAASSAKTRTNIYNSYIRAIRWASERINDRGVVAFCTSASYLTATATDGVRKCLAEEFSDLYVFNLRGDARTSGELRRKEKDNVFGAGSREPIAISVLVKNPKAKDRGRIFYRDIGDYLSQADKLKIVDEFRGIAGITESGGWQMIAPDKHGDWLKQRDDSFEDFILIGSKGNGEAQAIFNLYSDGAITNRDDWIYNASRSTLVDNVKSMIRFFDVERERYKSSGGGKDPASFVRDEETKIKWDDKLLGHIKRDRKLTFRDECLVPVVYRPFSKQWMYFDKTCIWSAYQMPRIFPAGSGVKNLAICTSGVGAKKEFFAIMVDSIIDRGMNSAGKAFPLHVIEAGDDEAEDGDAPGLFAGSKVTVLDAITDAGVEHFTSAYAGENISKEDVFYYIYGLFHSQDYRERYADNLSKELPRIPRVRSAAHFWAFSNAGRALAELHLNYETVEKYPLTIEAKGKLTDDDYRVEKMKFAKTKDPETGKSINDRRVVIYNTKITLRGIPEAAWDYVVNGKAALDWVMERQAVRVDKASGIVSDANDWAIETMGNPKYPLELFQRVVTVSLETQKIISALPALDIREDG
jgi:predicted helicase